MQAHGDFGLALRGLVRHVTLVVALVIRMRARGCDKAGLVRARRRQDPGGCHRHEPQQQPHRQEAAEAAGVAQ